MSQPFDPGSHIFPFDVFHGDEQQSPHGSGIVGLHDVGMAELGSGQGLPQESVHGLGGSDHLAIQQLDCHQSAQVGLLGQQDLCHSSDAQKSDEAELADAGAHETHGVLLQQVFPSDLPHHVVSAGGKPGSDHEGVPSHSQKVSYTQTALVDPLPIDVGSLMLGEVLQEDVLSGHAQSAVFGVDALCVHLELGCGTASHHNVVSGTKGNDFIFPLEVLDHDIAQGDGPGIDIGRLHGIGHVDFLQLPGDPHGSAAAGAIQFLSHVIQPDVELCATGTAHHHLFLLFFQDFPDLLGGGVAFCDEQVSEELFHAPAHQTLLCLQGFLQAFRGQNSLSQQQVSDSRHGSSRRIDSRRLSTAHCSSVLPGSKQTFIPWANPLFFAAHLI